MGASRADRTRVAHLRRGAASRLAGHSRTVTRDDARQAVEDAMRSERLVLGDETRRLTVEATVDEIVGFGPLSPLMDDAAVTEIMVNGASTVFVERAGHISATDVRFDDERHLRHTIDRLLASTGRRVDESSPMVDARLDDGSRVNVIIPPLAVSGPTVTIRRFPTEVRNGAELVRLGTLSEAMLDLLANAVRARRTVLVTGGTGSGKTTTLAALCEFIPEHERLITIEDAAELQLPRPHVVRLESRPPSVEGRGAVTIRDLVRNALRMRPDRIIVGEVRGGECVDMLTAMTTGHEGSLSTLHANSPDDAVRRLQTLALMADIEIPHAAVVEHVAHAIDLIVHQARMPDGSRRITQIASVGGSATEPLVAFEADPSDASSNGRFVRHPAWSRWASALAGEHYGARQ